MAGAGERRIGGGRVEVARRRRGSNKRGRRGDEILREEKNLFLGPLALR